METNEGMTLFGRVRRNVLGVLFSHPDERFYVREVARAAEAAPGAVQRELVGLAEAGILVRSARGNQVYYQANRQCPIFAELVGLVAKTIGIPGVLRSALLPLAPQIAIAFIYGSAARGEMKPASDIDLLIIGEISFARVVAAISPVQLKLAREINPTVYPPAEFRRKMAERKHFLTTVVNGPKVFLVGDERELAGMVQERVAE